MKTQNPKAYQLLLQIMLNRTQIGLLGSLVTSSICLTAAYCADPNLVHSSFGWLKLSGAFLVSATSGFQLFTRTPVIRNYLTTLNMPSLFRGFDKDDVQSLVLDKDQETLSCEAFDGLKQIYECEESVGFSFFTDKTSIYERLGLILEALEAQPTSPGAQLLNSLAKPLSRYEPPRKEPILSKRPSQLDSHPCSKRLVP